MDFPKQEKYTISNNQEIKSNYSSEYTLKMNKFDPRKDSPNVFLQKLEFRMKNYFLEEELMADNFSLDSK
jgi:hypothetical protein